MQEYWHKQIAGEPLYPDLLWSRPENRAHAGKLFIAGGNAHGFAAPAEAYQAAVKAGVGTGRVLLPDKLQKTVGRVFEAGEFAPSTLSGSFARKSLAEMLDGAMWADGTLLAGDFGRNSETAVMLEQFTQKYTGQLSITQDAADYFIKSPGKLLDRQNTVMVISFAQLQKIAASAAFTTAFTYEMDLLRLVEALHEFTLRFNLEIVTKRGENIFVASGGDVSTTKLDNEIKVWRVRAASFISVWRFQNSGKSFEAMTTAISDFVAN